MLQLQKILATAALGLAATSAAHANLVANGDFEDAVIPSGSYSIVSSISGWIGGPDIELQNRVAGSPFSGNQLIELDTTRNSSMFQDIVTTAGQLYTISFAYSPRPGVAASSNGIDFLWNGALVQSLAMSGVGRVDTQWTRLYFSLLATGASSRIGFAATGTSDSLGGYLDAVTADALVRPAAIPEPTTVALLGAGALFAAFGARRRRDAR